MFGINPVLDAFWIGMIFGTILALYFFVTHVQEDGGPERWQRWKAALIMWSDRRRERRAAADMDAVSIPVSGIGMATTDMEAQTHAAPDMDAINAGIPHFNRHITDGEWIAYMAVARGKDKKYRFSANAIHAAVGGDRNTVLAKVKEIRTGPPVPVFPNMTPEQKRAREALGLAKP